MIEFFICLGLMATFLLLYVVGVLPITRIGNDKLPKGYSGINYWHSVAMKSKDSFDPPIMFAAIYAQEVVESFLRWIVAFAIGLPFVYWAFTLSLAWPFLLLIPVELVLLSLWTNTSFGERQLEYIGQGVSVQFLKNHNVLTDRYLEYKAKMLKTNYTCFEQIPVEVIIKKMKKRFWIGKILMNLNAIRIKRVSGFKLKA